jgi:hypothetical protein
MTDNRFSSTYFQLFYILIAVLVLFACFSLLSWYRGRRRRRIIFAEARRLGLLVPGMEGYAAERDRLLQQQMSGITSASGRPEIWDVRSDSKNGSSEVTQGSWDQASNKERALQELIPRTLGADMVSLQANLPPRLPGTSSVPT